LSPRVGPTSYPRNTGNCLGGWVKRPKCETGHSSLASADVTSSNSVAPPDVLMASRLINPLKRVVAICTAFLNTEESCILPHTIYLCVSYDAYNKYQLFP
jgi:hypothetical protein